MNLQDFALERYFAKYEFSTELLLCSSDCESVTIADLLALEANAEAELKQLWLGYTESQGSPVLREAIGQLYSAMQPEQILVHSGAEEAIFTFMNACLKPGDHLIVHSPSYQSLQEVPRAVGVDVSLWPALEAEGWRLDLDVLKNLLQPNTKAVVLNCPHNPTGYLMQREDYDALIQVLRERGIILFSDEVYRGLEANSSLQLPAACDAYELGVSLGVMSKTYGLAGLRIGWVATQNDELRQQMAAFKDYLTICSSAPSEFLATLALNHRETLVKRNMALIQRNSALLEAFFLKYPILFSWQAPQAGPIAFPRLQKGQAERFCNALVKQENVLLLPSSVYQFGDEHFRIGFGRSNFPQALQGLERFINTFTF